MNPARGARRRHLRNPGRMGSVDELAEAAEKAARNAKRAAALAMLALAVAIAVLAIDNSIKRAILDEAGKARGILNEFKDLVGKHTVTFHPEVAGDGAQAAGETGTGPGGDLDRGDDVADAARASAAAAGDAVAGPGAGPGGPRRAPGGPRRNGG